MFGIMMLGILGVLFAIAIFILGLLGTIFWIWMLVDCATRETIQGSEKVAWILIILFTHFIGAAIYFFVRRSRRPAGVGQ